MLRRVPTLFIGIVSLLVLFGCDNGSPTPPDLTGDYTLETQLKGALYTYELDLTDVGGDVSGTGTLRIEDKDGPRAVTSNLDVSGTHNHPSVRLEMVAIDTENNARSIFEGNLSEDGERVSGTLTFPNGIQQQVTLRED